MERQRLEEGEAKKINVAIGDLVLKILLTDTDNEEAVEQWMEKNIDLSSPKIPILGLSIKRSLNGRTRLLALGTKEGHALLMVVRKKLEISKWMRRFLASENVILGGFTREMSQACEVGLHKFCKLRIHRNVPKRKRAALRLSDDEKKLGFDTIGEMFNIEIEDDETLFDRIRTSAIKRGQISASCLHSVLLAKYADRKNSIGMRKRLLKKRANENKNSGEDSPK